MAAREQRRVSILLVDDQPARLLAFDAILQDLGHEIVCASSGAEALEKLLRREFAVILLDVNMPGMDGFELAALVHDHPRFEKTPIIFVTGLHVTDMDRLRGYALGAVDYVYVPVVPEILRSKVSVLTELYLKRKELQELNKTLEQANAELFAANTSLRAEKTRELEAANAELAQTNSALKSEIEERQRLEAALRETDRRKDEFLAMLAHELRNPLAPILNGVRFMRMHAADDPELDWCRDMIGRQAEHMTRLVEDLLDVSRVTQGKISLQRTTLALDSVVARAIETNRPLLEARGHQFALDLPPRPVHVHGDMTRLVQIVGNLVNNAAKYTEDGGSIRVALETAQRPEGTPEALIRVSDTGIGIPPEMLPRVFDLFTQVERPVDRAQGGLGIGLALVRRLVELHGGRVEAHSPQPGGGSEFVVALPLEADPAGSPDEPEAAPAPARSLAPSSGDPVLPARRRVLVVDDNYDSAKSMALLLREMGHEAHMALDGFEGVRAVSALDPEIVFLDIGMPEIDGYEAARRIRGLPRAGSITLVALTGYGQPEDRRRSLAAGFDRHLVKPVERKDLDALFSEARVATRTEPPAAESPRGRARRARPDGPQQIAHDLRTPLNALWGTSELLLETSLDPEQREYASLILSSAKAIRRLADELAGASAGDDTQAAGRTVSEADAPLRPLRVLVVDDDPVNRAAMLALLASLGHACETAADGREAVSAVERGGFDVVLMDVQMDGMGGQEAARRVRESLGDGRAPRILGVTGTAVAAEIDACRAAGMDDVLVKPVELGTLRAALASCAPAPATICAQQPDEFLDRRIVASLRSQASASGQPLLHTLADLYGADTPGQIDKLREAAARGAAAELALAAHRLAGSSGVIGAKALGALASKIELLARVGDLSGAAPIVADLERAWPATRDALVRATSSNATAS
jgi:CheY-like chemotaxis protein/HPt (histidine-containing phosphotransfer) domain-containing protein/two-component sensor histidine kinase